MRFNFSRHVWCFFFYTKRTHKGLALQVHYMKKIISREFHGY